MIQPRAAGEVQASPASWCPEPLARWRLRAERDADRGDFVLLARIVLDDLLEPADRLPTEEDLMAPPPAPPTRGTRSPRSLSADEAVVCLPATTDPRHRISSFLVMTERGRPEPIAWAQEELIDVVMSSPQRFLAPRPERDDPRDTAARILARQGFRLAVRHPANPDRGWLFVEVYPECP